MKKDKEFEIERIITVEVSVETAETTDSQTYIFNEECREYREELDAISAKNQVILDAKLDEDPTYIGDRAKAVDVANLYETADVKMGGRGSGNWSEAQREELLQTGKLRGYEGHHINSVAEHPDQQTNPNNVKFYNGRQEHLNQGHGGNFRNPSSGEMIDRDAMLQQTNAKRVIENEIVGAGTAVALGAAVGLVSSVCDSCREDGVSARSIAKGVKKSGKRVACSSLLAFVSYGTVRLLSHYFN